MSEAPGLTVVVPAFDEEASLEGVVEECLAAAPAFGQPFELVIVDDGSRDTTPAIAARLAAADARVRLVRHSRNLGSGAAIRTGIGAARFGLVTYVPADGQFAPAELGRYVTAARDADLVVGVRTVREGDTPYRRLQSRMFRVLLNRLFGTSCADANWVHLWRRDVFERVSPRSGGVFFLGETLVLARAAGLRVVEVPSAQRARRAGRAHGTGLSVAARTVAEMLRLAVRMRREAPKRW